MLRRLGELGASDSRGGRHGAISRGRRVGVRGNAASGASLVARVSAEEMCNLTLRSRRRFAAGTRVKLRLPSAPHIQVGR